LAVLHDHQYTSATKSIQPGDTIAMSTDHQGNDRVQSNGWTLLSDAIIHRIHRRVLDHIQSLCERD
jgi:hypothetical protein